VRKYRCGTKTEKHTLVPARKKTQVLNRRRRGKQKRDHKTFRGKTPNLCNGGVRRIARVGEGQKKKEKGSRASQWGTSHNSSNRDATGNRGRKEAEKVARFCGTTFGAKVKSERSFAETYS